MLKMVKEVPVSVAQLESKGIAVQAASLSLSSVREKEWEEVHFTGDWLANSTEHKD